MNGSLSDLNNAIALSKKVTANIKMNLFWAFFYNCVGIPLAAGAFYYVGIELNPMIAAGMMALSSICVVLNALRLKGVKLH
jgi:Cu+-exporting ATPase